MNSMTADCWMKDGKLVARFNYGQFEVLDGRGLVDLLHWYQTQTERSQMNAEASGKLADCRMQRILELETRDVFWQNANAHQKHTIETYQKSEKAMNDALTSERVRRMDAEEELERLKAGIHRILKFDRVQKGTADSKDGA